VSPSAVSAKKVTPDERQREAIEHVHGPMLVIAGAGTGKTTVLTQRIAHLVREGHARPEEVLALTYTENAADEMKDRVRKELEGQSAQTLQAMTFHAWCNGLLARQGRRFDLLDDKDLWVFLRRRIRELNLKHFVRAANVGQFLSDLLDFMRRCHDELVGPEQYKQYVARLERGEIPLPRVTRAKKQAELQPAEVLDRCREIAQTFANVEGLLEEKNLGTFSHMITRAHALLRNDSRLLEEERGRIRFLLIDEFQDANFAQVEILSMLAGADANVFAVGDPDQAIYQFRGASSEAFNLFARCFPATRVVVLGKNRRSLSPILRCAFGLVDENPQVFAEKGTVSSYRRTPLESQREEAARQEGTTIAAAPAEIVTWRDKEVEAADLALSIRRRKKEGRCSWKDFAVLYRQHNHRDELVRELMERNVPFSIEGLNVLDTPEVRDVVGCVTAAVLPGDTSSVFRVAALSQFRIDPTSLRAAMRAVRREELDLRTVLSGLQNGQEVLQSIDEAHNKLAGEGTRAADAVGFVIRHFGLPQPASVLTFLKYVEAWQDKAVAETGSPVEFVEYLEYFGQAGGAIALPAAGGDAVRLMTAHAAKGLEFKHVAILRGSSNTFPCNYHEPLVAFPVELRSSPVGSSEDKILHEQEERRLFYVAMTRACDTLSIYTHQGRGKKDPMPSKFLRELMLNPRFKPFWTRRPASAVQESLFAEGEERISVGNSNVAAWLLMDPSSDFVTGLSASAVETYERCPLQFKLEREWNLPRDISAALQYGAAMHRVLRTFYDAQRFGRTISDAELQEQFRQDLASTGIADRYQYDLYLHQGAEQLRQFLEAARAAPKPDVIETEHRFEMLIGSTKVTGRVDRIDRADEEEVIVVDYKTGKAKSQDDADDSLQLSLYALAAREAWGKRARMLIFYNLETNEAVVTTRSDIELQEAKLRVEKAAVKIACGEFPAKPGRHCGFCPYRNLCPATEKVVFLPQQKSRAN